MKNVCRSQAIDKSPLMMKTRLRWRLRRRSATPLAVAGAFAGRLRGKASQPRARTAAGASGNRARQAKGALKLARSVSRPTVSGPGKPGTEEPGGGRVEVPGRT